MLDIAVDDSRNILYTLTEKGTIDVYDLGANGESFSRVATMSYSSLLSHAATVLRY
jgi:nuclear pore complex protein Nup155